MNVDFLLKAWAVVGPLLAAAASAWWGEARRRRVRLEQKADEAELFQRREAEQRAERERREADEMGQRQRAFAISRVKVLRELADELMRHAHITMTSAANDDPPELHRKRCEALHDVAQRVSLYVADPFAEQGLALADAALAMRGSKEPTQGVRLAEYKAKRTEFRNSLRNYTRALELAALGVPANPSQPHVPPAQLAQR